MENIAKIEAFYDGFSQRLLEDFVMGNERMESAIKFALEGLTFDTSSILDIGCGLGWSSYEFSQVFKNSRVTGVDLSQQLVQLANKLFKAQNLVFQKVDITSSEFQFNQKFDAIVLIDVYEHVPKAARKTFHEALTRLLSDQGRLVVCCPTPHHQDWLRQNNPGGLQPIDEDVTLENMQVLAEAVGGQLTTFVYRSIWQTNDYFHVLIDKEVKYAKINNRKIKPLSNKLKRLWMVANNLGAAYFPLKNINQWKYYLKRLF